MFAETLNESNFIIPRTRRYKIIENMSFESEAHNIYDPYFSSEEEDDYSGEELLDGEDEDSLIWEKSIENSDVTSECSAAAGSISSIENESDIEEDETELHRLNQPPMLKGTQPIIGHSPKFTFAGVTPQESVSISAVEELPKEDTDSPP